MKNTPMQGIVEFNIERGLKTFSPEAEVNMLTEELVEFVDACVESDTHEQVNALCDIIVLATGAMHKLGYDPEKALSETVSEIQSRQGTMDENTGKWEKDKDQDPKTLYVPNYENAKYL